MVSTISKLFLVNNFSISTSCNFSLELPQSVQPFRRILHKVQTDKIFIYKGFFFGGGGFKFVKIRQVKNFLYFDIRVKLLMIKLSIYPDLAGSSYSNNFRSSLQSHPLWEALYIILNQGCILIFWRIIFCKYPSFINQVNSILAKPWFANNIFLSKLKFKYSRLFHLKIENLK